MDFTVLLKFEFLKKLHLPVGQVNNRIHYPNSKIHWPRAIGHYFLYTLLPGVMTHFVIARFFEKVLRAHLFIKSVEKISPKMYQTIYY